MPSPTRSRATGVAALAAALALGVPMPSAAAGATLHPGISTLTGEVSCAANFAFTDAAKTLYLGQAALCSGRDDSIGCESNNLPLGTKVALGQTGVSGILAYSSWITMKNIEEEDEVVCSENDFALVRIPNGRRANVDPAVPGRGVPAGVRDGTMRTGEPVYTYAVPSGTNSEQLGPRTGVAASTDPEGWTHNVYLATPGLFGDAGAGVLDEEGRAVGVLTAIAVAPLPGSNSASSLALALQYAQKHSGIEGLRLMEADRR